MLFRSAVSLRSVTDVSVSAVFLADLLEGFHACTVVVKKAVDAFVIARRIESLVYIRYGVQYDVVLSVQLRIIRAAFLSQCQKGEIVHEPLEHITGIPRFPRLSDVGDFLWSDATLKIAVANLKPTRTIGKGDGKVPLFNALLNLIPIQTPKIVKIIGIITAAPKPMI